MKPSPIRAIAALLVLALTAAVLYAAVYKRFAAQIGLREAATMTSRVMARETPGYLRPGMAHDTLALLARLRSGSHDDQRVAMLRGMNELSLGRSEHAEESYLEALSWGRRPEIYIVLASAQAAQGREDAAIESLDQALRFDPASIINTERADLRAKVFDRFEANATKAQIAELYLSIAIAYFDDDHNPEGIEMAALAATHDPRILRRTELLAWGYLQEMSAARYAELQRERTGR